MQPQPPPEYWVWQGHTDGAIYVCQKGGRPPLNYMFWSATPPPGAVPQIDPAVLARQAVAAMGLRAVTIGIVPEPKPGYIGLVGMPTWMWITPTPETWGPQTRSASAGGITVTATAKVSRLVWNMGDGSTERCLSPGTPYRDVYGKTTSPTCGHTYTRTSVGQPGNAYTVSATSYWTVNWSGGGQNGVINMDFTSRVQIRVGEMQVLVTH